MTASNFGNAAGAVAAILAAEASMSDGDRTLLAQHRTLIAEERAATQAAEQQTQEQKQQPKPPQEQGGGLAHEDEWDKPGAINTEQLAPDDGDPFSRFKHLRWHKLETPPNDALYRFSEETLSADIASFGVAADQSGFSKDVAQSVLNLWAEAEKEDLTRVGPSGYNAEATVSELYKEWGVDQTYEHLTRVGKFVGEKPALAAWLDSTGLGNAPSVLRLLAAASAHPEILTAAGAKKYIDGVNGDMKNPYWRKDDPGHRFAVSTMKLAYQFLKD